MSNRLAVYCLFVGLLVACTLDEPPTPSVPTLTPVPPNTAFIAAALEPTALPTLVPTPSLTSLPTEIARFVPSLTPRPSSTPTPMIPTSYILPAWVNDPQAVVLLAPLRSPTDRDETVVSLLNAGTGERFDLWASEDYWHVKWSETTETGLALIFYPPWIIGDDHEDLYLHQVDINTGQMSQLPFSNINSEVQSAPGGYFAADTIDQAVIIIDQQTGQEITLNDPFNGRYPDYVTISWSVDGTLLAVQRYDRDDVNRGPAMTGLAIYTADGRLYRYYADVRSWAWAADGSYQLLNSVGDYFENGEPCILDIQANTMDCLSEVTVWRENGIEKTGYYQWLPDGSGISFLYWNHAPRAAGLCIMNMISRDITCPVNETLLTPAYLGAGAMTYIVDYQWSPDGRYLVLDIDPCGPECDDRTATQVTTIARDGSQFHVWGFGLSWNAEWRPQIATED
jgi:hypothetical protein